MSTPGSLTASPSRRMPASVAFPALSLVLFAFFFAGAAPTPMFIVMQHAWHFSASMLTVAFAVYALALLASLLVTGSLSDHVGRRPVVIGALVIQAVAMLLFLRADGIAGLIVARIAQGVATGIASGALTAAVVEAAPAHRKSLGSMITSVSPLAGLAVGALITGLTIRFTDQPIPLVFGSLAALFAIAAALMTLMPETVTRRPGALASMVPHVSIPPGARSTFLRAVPMFVAIWSLGGLYFALAPSMMVHLFDIDDGIVNGLTITALAGVGAIAPTLIKPFGQRNACVIGMVSLAAGLIILLASLWLRALPLFFVATVVAGVGFGGAFSAAIQALVPLARAHERGELFAAIFAVSYVSFSVPAMIAGLVVSDFGLLSTVQGYTALVLAVAVAGASVQWRGRARSSQ